MANLSEKDNKSHPAEKPKTTKTTNSSSASPQQQQAANQYSDEHCSKDKLQPFVKRREWFYQNISDDENPSEVLHIPATDEDILIINRGIPVNYTDVASIDPDYAKNLQWILDHDIDNLGLDLTFSVETDVFGVTQEVELKPGGRKITVTEENKTEYAQLVTELRMTRAIQPQINSFLSGFHQYIPQSLIQMFDEYELGGYCETCDNLLMHFPKLFEQLIQMVRKEDLKESMYLKVLKFLCKKNNEMADRILVALAEELSNIGHNLLSLSSNVEVHVSVLLTCVRVLCKLYTSVYQSMTSSIQSAVANGVTPVSPKTIRIFKPAESLWQLLEDWLNLLQVEFDQKSPKQSTENLVENENGSHSAEKPNTMNTTTSSNASPQQQKAAYQYLDVNCSKDKLQVSEGILKHMSLEDQDVIGATLPRICGVVQAFYITCSCHTQSEITSPRFIEFVCKHNKVLKALVQRNTTVIFDHFHFLLECPELMSQFIHIIKLQPFVKRREWFYQNISDDENPSEVLHIPATDEDILIINRERIFDSSCDRVLKENPDKLKKGLALKFDGEEGMGQGVVREWFDVLSKEILNPDYALFTQSADGSTFQPNSNSAINPDHLNYFRFAGQILGLCLYHKQLINVYFTRSFYKHILGIPVNYTDVASIDPDYAKNLQWILDHDIDNLGLDLTFSVETDVFGVMQEVELKPGGRKITVTEENKTEYAQLVTELRMTRAIQPQINSFLSGFHQYIPQSLIQMFDEYELELMLSGIPEIDISDWEKHTEYNGYDRQSSVIQWFWEIVEDFSQENRVLLLQFTTGSSRVPFGGFEKFVGGGGPQHFTIAIVPYKEHTLPTASTCINMLKMPEYKSKTELHNRLMVALQCGNQGYVFA
ncbi:E3 ubiquitin-protein ligase HACE1-like [Mytilus galloprovincialis]|uniref:E3 ubiquitin-protein ligase HACE1-like n=1 Tax=Mytilus galloprovincialis TaxID=29158 RepID=UPI003F7BDDD0